MIKTSILALVALVGLNSLANAEGYGTGGGSGLALDSSLQSILTAVQGAIPAGTNTIGKVGIDNTTGGVTAADATSLTNAVKDFALGGVYNGATVDMVRGGDVNNVAAATGYLNTLSVARYNATTPTLTDTRYDALQLDSRGSLNVNLVGGNSANQITVQATNNDGVSSSAVTLTSKAFGYNFNGSTWDRNIACTNFAAISVTASATTQIVALSGSTVIRICNAALSISASGSFDFISGTGSNCGTPANDTGAIAIASGTLQNISGGGGAAIYRGTAGGEFCVKATTGNVTGWVMYAQY